MILPYTTYTAPKKRIVGPVPDCVERRHHHLRIGQPRPKRDITIPLLRARRKEDAECDGAAEAEPASTAVVGPVADVDPAF